MHLVRVPHIPIVYSISVYLIFHFSLTSTFGSYGHEPLSHVARACSWVCSPCPKLLVNRCCADLLRCFVHVSCPVRPENAAQQGSQQARVGCVLRSTRISHRFADCHYFVLRHNSGYCISKALSFFLSRALCLRTVQNWMTPRCYDGEL